MIEDVQGPMVECHCCGQDVMCSCTIGDTETRFWSDVDQHVLFASGFSQRLRDVCQPSSASVESHVGLRPINERLTQIDPFIEHARSQPREPVVPPVVPCDGIWRPIVEQEETVNVETKGRRRKQRQGTHVVGCVA